VQCPGGAGLVGRSFAHILDFPLLLILGKGCSSQKALWKTKGRAGPGLGRVDGSKADCGSKFGAVVAHLGQENEAMSPEVSDLLKRALALSVDERAALANTLLDSLETTNESVQEAWDEEVARRIKDLKAGKAVTVPWEQLHRELLAMVNER
jgi:putative addiction module component (TIGR02574 family)